jgi:ribosomal protein L24
VENRKDFIGHQVCVGDNIVFIEKGYRNLKHGKVIAVNEHKATIELENRQGVHKTTQRFYSDLLKIRKDCT